MPTLTITTTAPQAQRISTAFGRRLNLRDQNGDPRSATAAEIKAQVIGFIRASVLDYERDEATQAARNAVPDITPS